MWMNMQNRFRAGQRASEVYSVQGSECWMRMMCGAIIPLGYFLCRRARYRQYIRLTKKTKTGRVPEKQGCREVRAYREYTACVLRENHNIPVAEARGFTVQLGKG